MNAIRLLERFDRKLTEFMLLRDGRTSLRPVHNSRGQRIKGMADAVDIGGDLVTRLKRVRGTANEIEVETSKSAARFGGAKGDPRAFLRHARALTAAADRAQVTAHTQAQWFGTDSSKPGLSTDQDTARLSSAYQRVGFVPNPREKAEILAQHKRRGVPLADRRAYSRYLRGVHFLKRSPAGRVRP